MFFVKKIMNFTFYIRNLTKKMEEILSQIQALSGQIGFDNTKMDECRAQLHELGPDVAFQSALISIQQSFSPLAVSTIFLNLNSFLSPDKAEISNAVLETFTPIFVGSQITISIWICKTLAIAVLNLELSGAATLSDFFASIENPEYSILFICDYFRQISKLSGCSVAGGTRFTFFNEFLPSQMSNFLGFFLENAENSTCEFLTQALIELEPSPMFILASCVGCEEAIEMYKTQCHPLVQEALMEFYGKIAENYSFEAFKTQEQRKHVIDFFRQTIPLMVKVGKDQIAACLSKIITSEKEDAAFYVSNILMDTLLAAAMNEIITDEIVEYTMLVINDAMRKRDFALAANSLAVIIKIAPHLEEGEGVKLDLQVIASIVEIHVAFDNEEFDNLNNCAENIAIIGQADPCQLVQTFSEIISQNSESLDASTLSLLVLITNELLKNIDTESMPEELLAFAGELAGFQEFQVEDNGSFVLLQSLMNLIINLYNIHKEGENQEMLEALQGIAETRISNLLAYVNEGDGNHLEFSPDMLQEAINSMIILMKLFNMPISDDFIFPSMTIDVINDLGKGQTIEAIVEATTSIDASIQFKVLSNLIYGFVCASARSSLPQFAAAIKELVGKALEEGQPAAAIRMSNRYPEIALECITTCAQNIETFSGSVVKAASKVGHTANWTEGYEEAQSNFIEILCSKVSLADLNPTPRYTLADALSDFLIGGGSPQDTTSQLILQWVTGILERGEGETCDSEETEKLVLKAFTDLPSSVIMSCPPEFFQSFLSYILTKSSSDKEYLSFARVFIIVMNNVPDGQAFFHDCLCAVVGECFNAEELIGIAVQSFDEEEPFNENEKRIIDALRNISLIFNFTNRY